MTDRSRAASPVIGIVLMVAVAVVLAAVLSPIALGFMESLSDPKFAEFETVENNHFDDAERSSTFKAQMESGNSIPVDQFSVKIGGTPASERSVNVTLPSGRISPGDQIKINQTAPSGIIADEEIVFVYTDSGKQYPLFEETTNGGSELAGYDPEFIFTAYEVGSQPGSPWTISTNSPNGQQGKLSVSDTQSQLGDRSVKVYVEDSTGGSYAGSGSATAELPQIDLTGVSEISFKFTDSAKDQELEVAIDGTTQTDTVQNVDGNWKTATVDVSSFTGDHSVSFNFGEEDAGGATTIYFDDVQFLNSQGDKVALAELQD